MGIKKACLSKCANTYYTSFHGREPQCDSLFLSNGKIISQNGSPCQKIFLDGQRRSLKTVEMTSEISQNQVVSTSSTTTFKHCQRRATLC